MPILPRMSQRMREQWLILRRIMMTIVMVKISIQSETCVTEIILFGSFFSDVELSANQPESVHFVEESNKSDANCKL